MTVYRTGSTEKVASAAFLETNYKTNALVTKKTTGVTAAAEVQKIAVLPLTQSVYVLKVGATTLTTASLDASPTIAELVTAIQAATGYGPAPFGVTAGVGDELVVTWESNAAVSDIAALTKNAASAGTTSLLRDGATGVKKAERIQDITIGDYAYTMVVDAVTLTAAALGPDATLTTLVNALKADGDYAGAPFTITALLDTILVEWKVAGTEADTAVLTYNGAIAGTTTVTTEGAAAVTEVQEFTPVLDANAVYRLTFGATELITSALDGTPTIAELNTAIQAVGGYAGAPFTTAVNGSKIEVTWKSAGAISGVSLFDFREYITGPYTAVIPAGVSAIRAISSAASNLKIGVNVEATTNDMLVPANTAVVFKVSPGDRVSFVGSADLFVTHLYE
jgi:hypothetical protein